MNAGEGTRDDSDALSLILEFARTEQSADPHAFRRGRLQYLVRGADGRIETAELNWDQELLDDLDAVRKPRPDPVLVQRLGETLQRFLQPSGWIEHESQIQQAVKERRRVILTLRSAAAELYALPWELITLKGSGQHIAELPEVLVRYEWPGTSTAPQAAAASPATGRVLVCWSAAAGMVPADQHIAAIQKACAQSPSSFDLARDVLPNVSMGRLDEVLEAAQRTGPPIVALHILCHGTAIGQTVGLALNGEDSEPSAAVDAGRLRQLLTRYAGMVRLVVLCACDSGNSGSLGNQLGSLAQTLHRAGIASVVASRYPLSVTGSIRLTQVLYGALFSENGSLEQAVLSARHNLARDADLMDWASLQLYARASEPAFQRPRYLRGADGEDEPAVHAAAEGGKRPLALPAARPRKRWAIWAGAGSVAAGLLIAGGLLATLGPEELDEGPIVLENGRCLNLEQGDFEEQRDGGDVNQWVCHGGANQSWHRDGRRIVNHNGLCLEVSPPDYLARRDGGRIQVGVCNPTMDNQQWQNSNKELRTYSNKCLAIELRDFESGKQGGAVVQRECTGKPNQRFSDGHRSR